MTRSETDRSQRARRHQQEEQEEQEPVVRRRGINLPIQVTAQEIITIAGIVISLALAWGTFQTKISLLEQINVIQNERIHELQVQLKEQSVAIQNLRDEVKEHILIDLGKAGSVKK